MNECEHCKKSFSTKSNLKNHQKTAKYCLSKQNIFKCKGCLKTFTTKPSLDRHNEKCNVNNIIVPYKEKIFELENNINDYKKEIINYKKQAEKYENQIKELQDKLERLATTAIKKPTTQTNNITTINLSPYKIDTILDKFSKAEITDEHVIDGQSGIARVIAPCLIDDDGRKMIKCNDSSRGVFSTIDEFGNVSKDLKARNLALAIEPIATEKAYEIIETHKDKINKTSKIKKLKKDIEKYQEQIEDINETLTGIKKDTNEYKYYLELIRTNNLQIERNESLIEKLENEGLKESDNLNENLNNLEKLNTGIINIQEMKKDTNKFYNSLAPLVK